MSDRVWERNYESHAAFYQDAYARYVSDVRPLGGMGVSLIEARQSAGDWSDGPSPDLTIGWLPSKAVRFSVDLGAGRFSGLQQANDVILVPPDSGASIQVDGAHVCRMVTIPYRQLREVFDPGGEQLPLDGDFGSLHSLLFRNSNLLAHLDRAWNVGRSNSIGSRLYGDGLVLQLLGTLVDLYRTPLPRYSKGGLAAWQERRVKELLNDRLADEVSLAELASHTGLSTFHFARSFKRSVGLAPHAYQRRQRCEKAKELLASTDLSIGEISAAVGYETPQAFARMFRVEVGMTPTGWRKGQYR